MSALELTGIRKAFPGVVALDGVSFSVEPGEIRALMGENGAGKSTLLKVISGEYAPDAGTVQCGDFAIIHQELHLVPDLSVAENLLLGALPQRAGLVDRRALRDRARAVLRRLGEDLDPEQKVRGLSMGKRQMVEIGKALLRDARVIAFDEPTSSLSARETDVLKALIRDLKAEGRTILYVSHRMEEVFELCDSLTVLRDGRHVATHGDLKAVSSGTVVAEMVGRAIGDVYNYRPRAVGAPRLAAEGVTGKGLSAPVSFIAHKGEILGFFGLIGAGRSELMRLLFGAERLAGGSVAVDGRPVRLDGPRAAIRRRLAFLSEDRKGEGIVPLFGVADNINLTARNLVDRNRGWVDTAGEKARAGELIERLRVKTATPATPIATLSGGNQQKALIARWLASDADIFLLDEPTRGIDVGARADIYALMYGLAEQGKTLVVVSSDLPEIMGVADRIIVMCEGRISGEVARADATSEGVLRLALPKAVEE